MTEKSINGGTQTEQNALVISDKKTPLPRNSKKWRRSRVKMIKKNPLTS